MEVTRLQRAVSVISLGAILGAAANSSAGSPEAPQIAQWIAQLGSHDFQRRERATRELDTLGAAALPSLKKALLSGDAETRRRAALLVGDIEARVLVERLLTPTKVSCNYKDTPLPEAVADLATRTGQPLVLGGLLHRRMDRKVTLSLKEVSVWHALEQFSRAANIREDIPLQPAQVEPYPTPLAGRRFGRGRWRFPAWNPLQAAQPAEFVLVDGKPAELPTHVAGAARIRAIPHEGPERGNALILLAVSLEAKVPLLRTVDVRVDRALDDCGQLRKLRPTVGDAPDAGDEILVANGRIVINLGAPGQVVVNPNGGVPHLLTDQPLGRIAVALTPGEKPARRLKELSGAVSIEVQTPPKPVLCVDRILRATGRTIGGDRDGAVMVREVARDESGVVQLWLDVVLPSDAPQLNWLVPPAVRSGFPNGPRMGGSDLGIALLDTKGEAFELVEDPEFIQFQTKMASGVTLTFRPHEGQDAPGRLIYSMARTAMIPVPFTLNDVPLP